MTIDTKTLTLVANEMRNWRSHAGFMSDRLVAWADRIDAAIASDDGLLPEHAATLRTMIHRREDGEVCTCTECRAIAAAIRYLATPEQPGFRMTSDEGGWTKEDALRYIENWCPDYVKDYICSLEQPDCRCVDCGGNQPKHDPTCSYMRELTGEQPEGKGTVGIDTAMFLPRAWVRDCQGKEDYDAELVSLSCRYYPVNYRADNKHSVNVSIVCDRAQHTFISREFSADTPADAKKLAEEWARGQITFVAVTMTKAFAEQGGMP